MKIRDKRFYRLADAIKYYMTQYGNAVFYSSHSAEYIDADDLLDLSVEQQESSVNLAEKQLLEWTVCENKIAHMSKAIEYLVVGTWIDRYRIVHKENQYIVTVYPEQKRLKQMEKLAEVHFDSDKGARLYAELDLGMKVRKRSYDR